MDARNEQMNIVIVGHVDHGKSTVIGRLLADTNSLPEGKLEQVKRQCAIHSKPFEYAFLLDALKNEQAQGITIDAARCFFKTAKRHYIIIDAPGHIEFLKNMITGASRAEAALLVIDANEGVQENSRRHGYLLSMLGIKQIAVLVNKMDMVSYNEEIFNNIKIEYSAFLQHIGVMPLYIVPVSAREGDNIAMLSSNMPWYGGPSTLEVLDSFMKEKERDKKPFRMSVQDVYKFTAFNDDRRIIAGTIDAGRIAVDDEVIFLPSGKKSKIRSIEGFNEAERSEVSAGKATGFTLATQVYVKAGELVCKSSEFLPETASVFKANIFWVGKSPMVQNKKYKLKIGCNSVGVYLKNIVNIIDASTLTTEKNKLQVDRHDVAECILQTAKPIAFDAISDMATTGRFVIIDNFDISGGGIIIASEQANDYFTDYVKQREQSWVKSFISDAERIQRFNQNPKLLILTGNDVNGLQNVAKYVEKDLFGNGKNVYYLGLSNIINGLDVDIAIQTQSREEHIRRLGEVGHVLTEAGMIVITTIADLDIYEYKMIQALIAPFEPFLVVKGEHYFEQEDISLDLSGYETPEHCSNIIIEMLYARDILLEYYI